MKSVFIKSLLLCGLVLLQACSMFTQRTVTEESTNATKNLPPDMAGFMGNTLLPGANRAYSSRGEASILKGIEASSGLSRR